MTFTKNLATAATLALASAFPTYAAPTNYQKTVADTIILAQAGWWTQCVVNLQNGIQIAVVNARTAQACNSAGRKCANGRPFHNIFFSSSAFLQAGPRIERCTIAY